MADKQERVTLVNLDTMDDTDTSDQINLEIIQDDHGIALQLVNAKGVVNLDVYLEYSSGGLTLTATVLDTEVLQHELTPDAKALQAIIENEVT